MMLKDRTVVLTGAAGGIGEVLTRRLLDEGAMVIAVDVNEAKLEALRTTFRGSPRLLAINADVSQEAACMALAEQVRASCPRVDILINNAGYFPSCDFQEMGYAAWQNVLRINLDSVFLMTRAILPLMEGHGWGRIINIGSSSVFRGVPTQVHYVTAKAGVIGFTRSLARVLGGQGITVNLIAPGLTSTPAVMEHLGAAAVEKRRLDRAIQREQQPQDLAGAVLFLASTGSDFMTGQILNVDGGANMH